MSLENEFEQDQVCSKVNYQRARQFSLPSLRNDPNSPTLREGSQNNTLNEISSNATDDETTANEEVDNDTDENIDDSNEHNKESTHAKTTELDLVKNSTTAIRAASK